MKKYGSFSNLRLPHIGGYMKEDYNDDGDHDHDHDDDAHDHDHDFDVEYLGTVGCV